MTLVGLCRIVHPIKMATSAFKSTSRRDTAAAETRAPPSTLRRRSQSVSAVSRKAHSQFVSKTQVPSEYSNSRDNPLFCASSSPSPEREESGKVRESAVETNRQAYASNSSYSRSDNGSCGSISEQRGRSVTRGVSQKEGIDRSLLRVRGRSMSRAPCRGAYQHRNDRDTVASSIAQRRKENRKSVNGVRRTNSVGGGVDMQLRAMKAGCQVSDWSEDDSVCSMRISNIDDGISNGSISEAEEKAGRAASNKLHACQRNNVNTFTASNIANKPSDFVNTESVDLMSEIRREYSIKLEESEERTRKLRADLAVEERHGKELDKILKEILPDSNTPAVPRSRRRRRASDERKEMSKCLTEEAMAYFDECVSLSTFDSSDFSASEDPPIISASSLGTKDLDQKQMYGGQARLYGYEGSPILTDSCSFEPQSTQRYNLSFTNEKWGPEESIMSYIKNFEKKDVDFEATPSYYDSGEYPCESVLIDRVLYKGRIESGGLLLCLPRPFT